MRVRETYKVNIDDRAEPKLKESLNEGTENGVPQHTSDDTIVETPTAFTTPLAYFAKGKCHNY